MKSSQTNIGFYPADKLKNLSDIAHNFYKGSNYSTYQAKISGIGGTEHFIIQTVAKGEHEGLNIDNLMSKVDKISHHHLFSLEYYSYELNLDDRLRRNWDIWFLYEPYKNTLDELIMRRKETNSTISEESLANFMKNMVSLFAYFQHYGIKHKPIHLKNFIITKNDSIKFDGIDLSPYSVLHPEATETPRAFRAPEEVSKGHVNQEKAEVFQLGLVFLYMASMQNVDKLNENIRLIKERIGELTKKFSKFVSETLKPMLSFNETERPSFEELYKQIKKNEQTYKIGEVQTNPKPKIVKTISFADTPKEEKKEQGLYRYRSTNLPSPELSGRKGSKDDNRRYSFGKGSPQMSKLKSIETETLRNKAPLEIWYEKERPKVKLLHAFLVGTKSLLIVPLISIKSLFVEIVELDIPFLIPSNHMSVCAENDRIYLIGGREEDEQDSNCYYYVDGEETLTEQESFLEPMRLNSGICSVGNMIYVMGGSTVSTKASLNSCEAFDVVENKWQEIASMKHKCADGMYCSYNDEFIYKFGGIDEYGKAVKIIEKYVIKHDRWIEISIMEGWSSILPAKNAFGTQVNDNEVFIFGGSDQEDMGVNQSFVFDCRNEKLKQINAHCPKMFSLDETRQNQVMVVQGEVVFLAMNPAFNKVCGFNSETWRELKKINTLEL